MPIFLRSQSEQYYLHHLSIRHAKTWWLCLDYCTSRRYYGNVWYPRYSASECTTTTGATSLGKPGAQREKKHWEKMARWRTWNKICVSNQVHEQWWRHFLHATNIHPLFRQPSVHACNLAWYLRVYWLSYSSSWASKAFPSSKSSSQPCRLQFANHNRQARFSFCTLYFLTPFSSLLALSKIHGTGRRSDLSMPRLARKARLGRQGSQREFCGWRGEGRGIEQWRWRGCWECQC
jgi:hypothetical protein